ncbi:MAG: hypothetical protein JW783_13450 [Bacteroidales bacterium]|nr:hypothetical protein [Bacteroidales bacterium]
MQKNYFVTLLAALLVIGACSNKTTTSNSAKRQIKYRVQAGANKGGITENTNLKLVDGANINAFSGATRTGINVGTRAIIPLKRNAIETGLDYMYNNQTFTYSDATNGYEGTRKVNLSQIILPVTYSIPLFKKRLEGGLFQVKLGYLAQVNIYGIKSSNATLPKYSTKLFTSGFTVGISSTPIALGRGLKLGFYIDGYRGTQAYEDFYNRSEFETAGTSFMKYGIILEF